MIRVLIFAVTGLACLATIHPADASGCRVVQSSYVSYPSPIYHAPTYYAPTKVVEKVVVKEVPVITKLTAVIPLVEYPSYSAVYTPPLIPYVPGIAPPAQQPTPAASDIQQILTLLKSFDDRLRRLETTTPPGQPAPAMQPAPKGNTSAGPLQTKCAICHDATKAATDGGGFVMFQGGNRAVFTDAVKNKIARKMRKGEMPPPNNKQGVSAITDEEYTRIAEELGF